jgi:GNAT superfamily N-acetyltransferase
LADNGYIVNDDEYWYVTDKGEQFLKQDVKEGFFDRFKKHLTADRNGIHLTATKDERRLIVDAIYNDERIGNAIFQVQGKNLVAAGVGVAPEYQGKGIGKIIYDWVKELGYTLNRSPHQTDAGKGFWDKHKGVEQNVWEASGYIPSYAEKDDPRFKTALTVDIKPDSLKKNAKAFGFDISRSGVPPQAQPSGKYKRIKK